jgi:NAD(P)-dependent dehydrogenase (short-subunit alcohol dehydrogenase family)
MKTVLITGCSTGFGLEIAKYFLDRDWKVVATMRTPMADILPASDRLQVLALDVTNADSIKRAVDAAGPIDVLVNNAGMGVTNAVEATSIDVARMVLETNTLGTIAVAQAVIPQMRERRAGTIINVSSSTTLESHPLISIYTASKAAVNAFTQCLALELAPFNIAVRLVLPGFAPGTPFHARQDRANGDMPEAYHEIAQKMFDAAQNITEFTQPIDVAEVVWRAATDPSCPVRVAAGADSMTLMRREQDTH